MVLSVMANVFTLQDVILFLPLTVVFAVSHRLQNYPRVAGAVMGGCLIVTARIASYLGGMVLPADILEQMDVTKLEDVKSNLRATWTNSALVGALLLTFAFPMAQVDFSDFEPTTDAAQLFQAMYPCACLVSIAFAALGTLSPTVALLYTDHLGPESTMRMVMCHPWCMGNPFAYVLAAFVWLLVSLTIWMFCVYGAETCIFAMVCMVYCLWSIMGQMVPLSMFEPKDEIWEPNNRYGKMVGKIRSKLDCETKMAKLDAETERLDVEVTSIKAALDVEGTKEGDEEKRLRDRLQKIEKEKTPLLLEKERLEIKAGRQVDDYIASLKNTPSPMDASRLVA